MRAGATFWHFLSCPPVPPWAATPTPPSGCSRDTLLAYKAHVEAQGVPVLGVTDHGAFHSIYFFDPNGHRLELACPDPDEAGLLARMDAVKWAMLDDWSQTKRAPHHADFLHAREFQRS